MSFINAILKKVENPAFAGQQWLTFCPTIKVNVDQQLFGYTDSSKYLISSSTQEMLFGSE